MYLKSLHHWLLAGLIGIGFFVMPAQAAESFTQERITLEQVGDYLISPTLDYDTFSAVSLQLSREVSGLMVNFGTKWEMVEVHDDGFGAEAFVLTSPTNTIRLRKAVLQGETRLIADLDVFHSEESDFAQDSSFENLVAGPQVAQAGYAIIKRAKWGADESLRYWEPNPKSATGSVFDETSDGETAGPCDEIKKNFSNELGIAKTVTYSTGGNLLSWPLTYSKNIKKIVIHHTDSEIRDINGDSRLNSRDYKGIVRAIYRFHTVTRGWGDIGYNYLIDPMGNIYEGRYGGDRVIGAHALCHNNGSIGIAIIGNYQETEVPQPALDAITWLVAEKAEQFHIDVMGESPFRGKRLSNIIGHKDVRSTACPGKNLYSLLPRIRERAGFILKGRNLNQDFNLTSLDFNAEFQGGWVKEFSLLPGEHKELNLQFTNTGQKTWDDTTWMHVALNNNPNARIVPLVPDKTFVAAHLKEVSVPPSKTGSFAVEVAAGFRPGDYEFQVSPVANGRFKISRSSIKIPFTIEAPQFNYEIVKINLPNGTVFAGQDLTAWVELKNTGNTTWRNYGENPIVLGTEMPRDHASPFVKNNSARLGHLVESEVVPGKTGRFIMNLEVPTGGAKRRVLERFSPVIEGVRWLPNKGMQFEVSIKDPVHKVVIEKVTTTARMQPGEMTLFEIKVTNEGDIAWTPDNMSISIFSRGMTVFKKRMRPTEVVEPGKSTLLSFWAQAPHKAGRHSLSLRSRYHHKFIKGGDVRYSIITEDPKLRAKVENQTGRQITLRPWEEKTLHVSFKNNGNTVWRRDGPGAVYLAPSHPQDRKSGLYFEEGWVSRYRAGRLTEEQVLPGEIGTYSFTVRPTVRGISREYFQLVIEKVGWIPGSMVRWDINVSGSRLPETSARPITLIEAKAIPENPSETETSDIMEVTMKNEEKIIENPAFIPPPATDNPFRVRLSHKADRSVLVADTNYVVTDEKGAIIFKPRAHQNIEIAKFVNGLEVKHNNEVKRSPIIRIVPQRGGVVEIITMERHPAWSPSLNDNMFRDILEMRVINDEVAYINELPLETYLLGVGEVSNSAPAEKQKAIAVLARTYARFYMQPGNRKFPNMPYDGNDDPAIFQKYLGYGYEIRSPNFSKAVNATGGEVVTYNDKLIKTPYFSQSDGRTRSAEEVWGWKDTPYLQSVSDPFCEGLTMQGHGVGLSGCGSEQAAKNGKTYEAIIKYYYQNVEIEEVKF